MKELPERPTLWLKPPGDTPLHTEASRFLHPWYPEHKRLTQSGWLESTQTQWQQIVYFGGRHKEENRSLVRACRSRLSDDGLLYFVLPNEYGGKSVQKSLVDPECLVKEQVGRKSRLLVMSPLRKSDREAAFFNYRQNSHSFQSIPGLFSWDKPDRGSAILGQALAQQNFSGPVADLGSGWGYLGCQLPSNLELHNIEADLRGLKAAERNIDRPNSHYHWADATDPSSGALKNLLGSMRTVITNPPFHTGKKAEPVLGGAFVAVGHKLLKTRGQLFLVGNSHLPYKRIMQAFFPEVEEIVRQDGFTVLRGHRS